MNFLSRYWNIWRINPCSEKTRYTRSLVPNAKDFFQEVSSPTAPKNGHIQATLFSYFDINNNSFSPRIRATATLCLRCYISEPLLKACKRIANLFSGTEKQFNYQDLLPFVLNDDGECLIILDEDRKRQLILDNNDTTISTDYKIFSVEVLRTFRPNSESSMSLDNWAYLQTKQNPEIKSFLSEFGLKHLSDWALMNRARLKQLERLSMCDRHLVEIFHAVYRRDRLQQGQKGVRKCPNPSTAQLQEMIERLQERDIAIKTTEELFKQLKKVATQLRQYDIWSYREPLEIYNPDLKDYAPRPDLHTDALNELDVEQQELLEFFHQQLKLALVQAIEQEMTTRIEKLKKSKNYAVLAEKFIPGLQLYYCQNKSLKEIAPLLGMTSWDQARRVLNPGEVLTRVRELTVQQVLDRALEKAQIMGLTKIPPEPDYLKTLAEQVEAFADGEIFQEAVEEIRTGKNRSLNSLYAQELRLYLNQPKQFI